MLLQFQREVRKELCKSRVLFFYGMCTAETLPLALSASPR